MFSTNAKKERSDILEGINKFGLISNSSNLTSATRTDNRICANIVKPEYIENVEHTVDYAINNSFCGANAIAIERQFSIPRNNLDEVEYLFNKRLKYNVVFIIEQSTLTEDNRTETDILEGNMRGDNRHQIKAVFAPKNLYDEVKLKFNDVEVIHVDFKNTIYSPHERFVAAKIKFNGPKDDLIDCVKKQGNKNEYLSEFSNKEILNLIRFNVLAPDYATALKNYLTDKKDRKDDKAFAVHLVRLPNNLDQRLVAGITKK